MAQDLIERYIYAVTKKMPAKVGNDVSGELRTLIEDMLAERCGEVTPTEKDIRIVLIELGNPSELYQKYNTNEKQCLIGGEYYPLYILVLKIVLASVVFGMTVAFVVTKLISPMPLWYNSLLEWLNMLWSGVMSGFTFITLLFAFFYRKNIKITDEFNLIDLGSLPPVPNKKQSISRWESIFDIGFTVIFLIVFLATPQIICAVFTEPARTIPIFNIEAIRSSWYIIALFGGVGILRESVKLIEGRYNKKVMITTIVTNAVSAVLAFWWLLNDKLMNPEFTAAIPQLLSQDPTSFATHLLANFQYFLLGAILFALLLDTAAAVAKSPKE